MSYICRIFNLIINSLIMEIVEIHLKNYRQFDNLSLNLESNQDVVYWVLLADNQKGKSTLLEIIFAFITGKFDSKDLVKKDKERGFAEGIIKTDNGNIKIRFDFVAGTTPSLKITYPDGTTSTAKKDLRALFNHYIDIDPDEWLEMGRTAEGRKEQIETVKRLLPLDKQQQIAKIQEEYEKKQPESEEAWNDIVIAEKILNKIGEPTPEDRKKYEKEKDIQTLSKQIQAATNEETEINNAKKTLEDADKKIQEKEEVIKTKKELKETKQSKENSLDTIKKEGLEKLRLQYEKAKADYEKKIEDKRKELKDDIVELDNTIKEKENEVETLKVEKEKAEKTVNKEREYNIEELNQQMNNLNDYNKKVAWIKDYDDKLRAFIEAKNSHKNIRDEINALKRQRESIIKSCNLPVPELMFDENGLYVIDEDNNRLPYLPTNISTSQNMRIVLALNTVLNPQIPIFRIKRAESIQSQWEGIKDYMDEYHKKTGEKITVFTEMASRKEKDLTLAIYEDLSQPDTQPIETRKPDYSEIIDEKKRRGRKKTTEIKQPDIFEMTETTKATAKQDSPKPTQQAINTNKKEDEGDDSGSLNYGDEFDFGQMDLEI